MNYNILSLEIITAVIGMILLAVGILIPSERKKTIGYLSVFSLVGIFVVSIFASPVGTFLGGIYVNDQFSLYFKQLFIISAILVSLMSLSYSERLEENRSEFFVLGFFALLGMMIMASANDFITLYIGLELMTITFIIYTAFETNNLKSNEAGVKYVLLSAISSAVLLYGLSLVYGLSGTTLFGNVVLALQAGNQSPLWVIAIIMIMSGFAFKISAVPFHMWSPDIYEGAPSPVTAFLAIGSKVAAFAALFRVFFEVFPSSYSISINVIITLAVLTMVIGNLIAIPQENIKRLLAFSSIAHAGYILLGLVAYSITGLAAGLFYFATYIFANAAIFSGIIALSNTEGHDKIKDFSGMWKRSPFISVIMLISLLSLAGIPPAAGFIGKFYLFIAVIQQGHLWLALVAILMSVVSVYYYMTVAKGIFMGSTENAEKIKVGFSLKAVMIVCAVLTILMGIYPTPILDWAANAALSIF